MALLHHLEFILKGGTRDEMQTVLMIHEPRTIKREIPILFYINAVKSRK